MFRGRFHPRVEPGGRNNRLDANRLIEERFRLPKTTICGLTRRAGTP